MYQPGQISTRGLDFARYVIAKAGAQPGDEVRYAASRWGEKSLPALMLKAEVLAGTSGEGWAGPLVPFLQAAAEFIQAVEEQSIVGQAGLRRVPLRTYVVAPTESTVAYWHSQASPKPVSAAAFSGDTLMPMKIAAMTVLSDAVVRLSNSDAEDRIRRDLIRAVAAELDATFIDPSNDGVAGSQPASVTNGVTPVAATGDLAADLRALIAAFDGDLSTAVFVGRPELFAMLSGADHPDIGARGGSLLGIPALSSRHVPAGVESPPEGDNLVLLDGSGIAFGAGTIRADISRQGTVFMSSTPEEGEPALVSLWQKNLVGILVERDINWRVARPGSVAVLSGIEWGEAS